MKIEIEKEDTQRLEGVSDLHVYCGPCAVHERMFDEIDFARQARDVGYRACLSKSHHTMNADRVQLVRKIVPGFGMYGGVVLNHLVGGLNPDTVEAAIHFGAKIIWMPNFHSANHARVFGTTSYVGATVKGRKVDPITIFGQNGKILPVVYEILDLVAKADIIIGTGHLSVQEGIALAKAAKERGVKKVLAQHVDVPVTNYSVEDQLEMAKHGAFLEHGFERCVGDRFTITPKEIAERIKQVGPSQNVLASALGVAGRLHPIEGMRLFIRAMLSNGISENDVEKMTKYNPATLLGLD